MTDKPYMNEAWLREEYLVKNRTAKSIAKEFGRHWNAVMYRVRKFGLCKTSEQRIALGYDNVNRVKKRTLNVAQIKYFVNKYCIFDENARIHYKLFMKALNRYYRGKTVFPKGTPICRYLDNEIKYIELSKGRSKFEGIRFNDKGLKRFTEQVVVDKATIKTASDACKARSCQPFVEMVRHFCNINELLGLDVERMVANAKIMEKKLFVKNLNRDKYTKLTTVLYISSELTQAECSKRIGTNIVSVNRLLNLVGYDVGKRNVSYRRGVLKE